MQVHIHVHGQAEETTAPASTTAATQATDAGAAALPAELTAMLKADTANTTTPQDGGSAPASGADTADLRAVVATLHKDGTDGGGAPAM
jgi:hypothetical protein